jgi:hypothetical protein
MSRLGDRRIFRSRDCYLADLHLLFEAIDGSVIRQLRPDRTIIVDGSGDSGAKQVQVGTHRACTNRPQRLCLSMVRCKNAEERERGNGCKDKRSHEILLHELGPTDRWPSPEHRGIIFASSLRVSAGPCQPARFLQLFLNYRLQRVSGSIC